MPAPPPQYIHDTIYMSELYLLTMLCSLAFWKLSLVYSFRVAIQKLPPQLLLRTDILHLQFQVLPTLFALGSNCWLWQRGTRRQHGSYLFLFSRQQWLEADGMNLLPEVKGSGVSRKYNLKGQSSFIFFGTVLRIFVSLRGFDTLRLT